MSVGYYRTWYGNFLVTDNTLVSPSRLRFVFHHGADQYPLAGARVQPGIELHNALTASTVHTLVMRYGPVWEGVRVCSSRD